jgi:hypothetical protein
MSHSQRIQCVRWTIGKAQFLLISDVWNKYIIRQSDVDPFLLLFPGNQHRWHYDVTFGETSIKTNLKWPPQTVNRVVKLRGCNNMKLVHMLWSPLLLGKEQKGGQAPQAFWVWWQSEKILSLTENQTLVKEFVASYFNKRKIQRV